MFRSNIKGIGDRESGMGGEVRGGGSQLCSWICGEGVSAPDGSCAGVAHLGESTGWDLVSGELGGVAC